MSRGKKATEPEEKDYIEVTDYEDVSDLEQALSGLPQDDSIIYLYRMYDRGRPKFLAKLEPAEFDLELIKETYGGGRFRYAAKKGGAVIKEGQFEIEGDPRTKLPDDRSNGQTTIGNYDVIKMLQDEVTSLKTELAKKAKEAEGTLATMLTTLLQSQNANKQSIDDIESSLLSKLSMYKSLFTQDKPDIPVETLFNAMSKGMEIASTASGDSTPLWLTVAEKLKEPLMQIAANMATPRIGPAPVKKNPVIKKEEVNIMSDNPVLAMIKPYIPFVIIAASKNSDPTLYADLVIDNIPEDKINIVKEWLTSDKWLSDLVSIDNRISYQASWWSELKNMILEGLNETKEDNSAEVVDNVNT